MPQSRAEDTRERLLEAAEELFSARGVGGVSLRELTRHAGANIAAVNYHFGSKLGLVQALCGTRLRALNQRRLARLSEVRDGASLEAILRAYIAPTAAMCRAFPVFLRLYRRLELESPEVRAAVFQRGRVGATVEAFGRALAAALPGAPLVELFWRMHFLTNAIDGAWAGWPDPEALSGGRLRFDDEDAMVERLVRFAAAGLRECVG